MFCIRVTSSKKDPKLRRFPLLLLLCANCGCARDPLNAPLDRIDQDSGYRLNNRTLGEKTPLFIVLGLPGIGARDTTLLPQRPSFVGISRYFGGVTGTQYLSWI
jgi:hypothetical protein